MKNVKTSVSIIGAGRLGSALAIALEKRGYDIKALVARKLENASRAAKLINSSTLVLSSERLPELPPSDLVFIVTPDPEIRLTAERLATLTNFDSNTIFLHTSGSLSSEILQNLREAGAKTGSLHPLVAVSDSQSGAEKFAGAFFCIEGEPEAVEIAKKIVADLGGNAFSIATEYKALYHAAAVMAAGHLVALFDAASEALSNCGIEKTNAEKILLPLIHSAIENLSAQTPEKALTGTFARADIETMERHLAALQKQNPDILLIYGLLGLRSIKLAAARGVDQSKLAEMRRKLDESSENQNIKSAPHI